MRFESGFGNAGAALLCLAAALFHVKHVCAADELPPAFAVKFTDSVSLAPYSGRVWVILSQAGGREPRLTVGWSTTSLLYARDVEGWKPNETLELNPAECLTYGKNAQSLPSGKWQAQAVIDLNRQTHEVLNGPGNGYSKSAEFDTTAVASRPTRLELTIDQSIPPQKLEDRENQKYIALKSRLLSEFFKRDAFQQAVVYLPKEYADEPAKRYPAVYVISGFGDTIRSRIGGAVQQMLSSAGGKAIVVYLDADCPTGHHVFADSENNGPVGTALVEELIPHLEKEFRLIPDAAARFLTGHSSGGWASLWLQVRYPDTFGGCWSSSPDPVDFHAFQTVDIYATGANMFVDENGEPRPISRPLRGDRRLMTRPFCELEEILGRGGQLQSFEAVFSPRGPDGRPLRLWDRKTGEIDAAVAQRWRKYDIRAYVESNWEKTGPKLAGKLHLVCGDQDSFYLEAAFYRLRDALGKLNSDAKVEVVAGADHNLPRSVFEKTLREMIAAFPNAP